MSAAGDVLRAVQAASSPFPPLEAALGLVSYIDQSITQFKSNKNEIKAIGGYSKELSQQLKRHKPAHPTAGATQDFCKVIGNIHAYVKEVSKMHALLQYFQRRPITDRLQDYRNQLREQFEIFSIASDIDIQEAQRAAEDARQADTEAMQQQLCKISVQITTSNTGVSQFAKDYGLSKIHPSVGHVLHELEKVPQEERTAEETTVLKESLELSKILVKSDYRWFSETFNATENSEFDIKDILAIGIVDCVRKLIDARLLSSRTKAEINHERNDMEKVTILFRSLNARSRDAPFIRSFQRAIYNDPEMRAVLNESLKLTFEGEQEEDM
ncbi:hypothetical protein DFH08DRAFT_126275 [Mycena albidolilacea]|uniref:Uncharacterized protein n=1 Tax=Mycena albidolilacea TaxID=1033008 RepID=A0AAD7ETP5_9AGAR|nr:hypothetical protein DFH08DRAFT_126275 [Mycena albidolilacea]